MKVAILGQGNMGSGLAKRLAGKLEVGLGARQPKAGQVSYAEAVDQADIVILALPFDAALAAASTLSLENKVVVDVTNALTPDYSGLRFANTTSAAETLQASCPDAKVVKGFNTIFSGLFQMPDAATAKVPVFLAGNDASAVAAVAGLAELAGFASEKTGALDSARLLEPLAMLNIRLAFGLGKGASIAPVWLQL